MKNKQLLEDLGLAPITDWIIEQTGYKCTTTKKDQPYWFFINFFGNDGSKKLELGIQTINNQPISYSIRTYDPNSLIFPKNLETLEKKAKIMILAWKTVQEQRELFFNLCKQMTLKEEV